MRVWSLQPIVHAIKRKLAHEDSPPLTELARRSWVIAAAESRAAQRAFFLPDQLERVTGWAFCNEHPGREMMGGFETLHTPTRCFELNDVLLIDGALYKGDAWHFLHPQGGRLPRVRVGQEIDRAAIFCTPGGNKYFGQWLMDDCVTYPLAQAEGLPVTTARPAPPHEPAYEAWLGMAPKRIASAFFRRLLLFDDVGQNRDKHARFRSLNERLLSRVQASPHPGVFILRGQTGERRVLRNEQELAEALRERRGFRILDPKKADVPAIVAACAGARTVIGVEGSGLMHGVLALAPGGAVLTLQPPNRFVPLYKHLTDRDHQHFGFVVGVPEDGDFRVELDEVERTLDLFPEAG
jgi:hypothetical protein